MVIIWFRKRESYTIYIKKTQTTASAEVSATKASAATEVSTTKVSAVPTRRLPNLLLTPTPPPSSKSPEQSACHPSQQGQSDARRQILSASITATA
ncbi:hypothetical protein A0H81_00971 [Grifola frondosa]|uniref:Uncharacterized protein n=1 Tax=Grifola frondosa TaxID=5627 RepID=A0A1C7MNZ4_GRIFR|nr:hypothetical protein A0H81_00971 [Grifola frondosa]